MREFFKRWGAMKRVLSALVVSTGLVVVALAVAGAASANTSVPFEASFSGTSSATGPSSFLVVLSGEATHLGKSSETVTVTLTPGPGPFCNTDIGSVVLTGANGDQIFEAVTATTCFNLSTGLVDLSGTATITGGTGRFEGASGTITVTGTINPATGENSTMEEGSISY